jgi:SPP1 gp7 family putative phage head morphogenesis protein
MLVATEFADMPEIDWYDPDSVTSMLTWFRTKEPISAHEFYGISAKAQSKAFTVSGVTDLDIVSDVWRAIDEAVSNGETLREFQARIGDDLESQWGKENPSRLETIFRTNVQSAYSYGRYIQNNKPEVKSTHPYSRFSAVLDDRTTDECEAADGTVLPTEDPWWADHQPPLHFNCRSDVSALTEDEAKEEGIDEKPPEGADPMPGFGSPFVDPSVDLSTRPPDLAAIFELKQKQALQNSLGTVVQNEGATINPESGRLVTKGYAVSTQLGHEEQYPRDAFLKDGSQIVADYKEKHADALAKPGAKLGLWFNSKTDHYFIDVSTVVKSEAKARSLGEAHGQYAIYDITHGREIQLKEPARPAHGEQTSSSPPEGEPRP